MRIFLQISQLKYLFMKFRISHIIIALSYHVGLNYFWLQIGRFVGVRLEEWSYGNNSYHAIVAVSMVTQVSVHRWILIRDPG